MAEAMPAQPDSDDATGDVCAGSWGVVYSAIDSLTGNKVAVKFSKQKPAYYEDGSCRWRDPWNTREKEQMVEEYWVHAAISKALPNEKNILKMLYACEVVIDLDRELKMSYPKGHITECPYRHPCPPASCSHVCPPDCLPHYGRLPGAHKRHAFVLEFASGHNLMTVLANHEGRNYLLSGLDGAAGGGGSGALPIAQGTRDYLEKDKRDLFRQILTALKALHGAGFTHRDIKPENIMLRHQPVAVHADLEEARRDLQLDLVVFDFGLAINKQWKDVRSLPRVRNFTGNIGTTFTLPPEVLSRYGEEKPYPQDSPYKPPLDMFSSGVVLYLMLMGDCHGSPEPGSPRYGCLPFGVFTGGAPRLRMLDAAAAPLPRDPTERDLCILHHNKSLLLSEEARALLVRLLDPNPATRITASEALAHPWFAVPPSQLHSHVSPAQIQAFAGEQARQLRESRAAELRFLGRFGAAARGRAWLAHARRVIAHREYLKGPQVAKILAVFHELETERRRSGGGARSGSGSGSGSGEAEEHPPAKMPPGRWQGSRAVAVAMPVGGGGKVSPEDPHISVRGLSRHGLEAMLIECGVETEVIERVLPVLWLALASPPPSLLASGASGEAGGGSGAEAAPSPPPSPSPAPAGTPLILERDFLTVLPLLAPPPQAADKELSLYFELWDTDGNGMLDPEELATLMEAASSFLPAAATPEEEEARHAQLLASARIQCDLHPERAITKRCAECVLLLCWWCCCCCCAAARFPHPFSLPTSKPPYALTHFHCAPLCSFFNAGLS